MRLVLDVPAAWAPAIAVTIGPSCLLPDRQEAWIQGIVGERAVVTASNDTRTTDGWPVRMIESGERVIAIYAFLEHGVWAIVSGADLTGRLEEIRAVLLAGRPDWRGEEVVALAELWD